ncbi:MAG TPA: 7-cyano-7-deazaguanine synthase, partial [Nitrolancea sp.]|nr:7-cyano-7-deazaguanine synthase [Nitrolancea sp.]
MTFTTPTSGPAVVLLSGGLDSTTAAYLARASGFAVHALSFDYGQRHRRELDAAAQIARQLGSAEHRVIRVSLSEWAESSLTGT